MVAVFIAIMFVIIHRPDDRKPAVRFLGFTDVLNRRVARFAVSNTTDRAFVVTTSPPNGYIQMPVEPMNVDYVDVPNPLTNRFWPAQLHFQVEAGTWRKVWDETWHGRFQSAGMIARQALGTNNHRYFIAHPNFDYSIRLDDRVQIAPATSSANPTKREPGGDLLTTGS